MNKLLLIILFPFLCLAQFNKFCRPSGDLVSLQQQKWLADNGFNETIAPIVAHKTLANNFAILDANNNYQWMVEIPAFNWSADSGFTSLVVHPAFIVNGVQRRIFVGKFEAGLNNGKIVTWQNQEVMREIKYGDANTACNSLDGGSITGFHMLTNAEWAAVAMVSKNIMGAVEVDGNNNYGLGQNLVVPGTPEFYKPDVFTDQSDPARWLSGSGGITTSHNGEASGIYDMNGNVWEWVKGLRLNDGEINVFTNNDGAVSTVDISSTSASWKAILEDGTLVAPGTSNTLKFNNKNKISKTTTGTGDATSGFEAIVCESDVSSSSAGVTLLKKLLLYPFTSGLFDDYFYANISGEVLPVRGGTWYDGAYAGLFTLGLSLSRGNQASDGGFRVAFVQ